jgi:hypothetical protein
LRAFAKKVLRKIVGPKKEEVTAEYRKFCNKEFNMGYSNWG